MKKEVEIIAKGRGLSFRQNLRKTETENDEAAFEIYGEPTECFLGMVSDMVQGYINARVPVLLYPDGKGGLALAFEIQNEDGEWEQVDLAKLV